MINHKKHVFELQNRDKIFEITRNNIISKFKRRLESNKHKQNFSNKEQEFILSNHFTEKYLIKENANGEQEFIPKFELDKFTHKIFSEFPPNKELRYSSKLMKLAMMYGMIIQIQYRGSKDNFIQGRTRVVYPMCLGTSAKGKPLLRVYHLKGWSYSRNKNIEKVWRLFRTDRILSISFTGMFFRLAPEGYNALDKGMRGGIEKAVDIKEIKNNQSSLVDQGVIQNKKEVTLSDEANKTNTIEIQSTNTILNLRDPFKNQNIDKNNLNNLRITFLKSTTNNKRLAVLGAISKKGNNVKVIEKGKYLGVFKVVKYTRGNMLNKPHLKQISGSSKYELVIFLNKK